MYRPKRKVTTRCHDCGVGDLPAGGVYNAELQDDLYFPVETAASAFLTCVVVIRTLVGAVCTRARYEVLKVKSANLYQTHS